MHLPQLAAAIRTGKTELDESAPLHRQPVASCAGDEDWQSEKECVYVCVCVRKRVDVCVYVCKECAVAGLRSLSWPNLVPPVLFLFLSVSHSLTLSLSLAVSFFLSAYLSIVDRWHTPFPCCSCLDTFNFHTNIHKDVLCAHKHTYTHTLDTYTSIPTYSQQLQEQPVCSSSRRQPQTAIAIAIAIAIANSYSKQQHPHLIAHHVVVHRFVPALLVALQDVVACPDPPLGP